MILKNYETDKYDINCDTCGFRRSGFDSLDEAEEAAESLGYVKRTVLSIQCPACFAEDVNIAMESMG